MLKLVIRADDGSEREVVFREGVVRVGRSPDNDIVLPDAHKGVSRTHAELRFEDGRWFILDLNSQNGTWLNGHRVQRGELAPGTETTLGLYKLVVPAEPGSAQDDPALMPRPDRPQPKIPPGAMAATVPVPVLASPSSDAPSRANADGPAGAGRPKSGAIGRILAAIRRNRAPGS